MKSLLETQIFKLHKTRVADDTSRNSVPQKTGNKRKKKKTKKIKKHKKKNCEETKNRTIQESSLSNVPLSSFFEIAFHEVFFWGHQNVNCSFEQLRMFFVFFLAKLFEKSRGVFTFVFIPVVELWFGN